MKPWRGIIQQASKNQQQRESEKRCILPTDRPVETKRNMVRTHRNDDPVGDGDSDQGGEQPAGEARDAVGGQEGERPDADGPQQAGTDGEDDDAPRGPVRQKARQRRKEREHLVDARQPSGPDGTDLQLLDQKGIGKPAEDLEGDQKNRPPDRDDPEGKGQVRDHPDPRPRAVAFFGGIAVRLVDLREFAVPLRLDRRHGGLLLLLLLLLVVIGGVRGNQALALFVVVGGFGG